MYKSIDYWPILDFLAIYGSFLNNMIIVWIAIYFNANLVMGFNMICVGCLYMVGTKRLNEKAVQNRNMSGLQS